MKIDARGKQCPLPVIEAKNALKDAPDIPAYETYEELLDAIKKAMKD